MRTRLAALTLAATIASSGCVGPNHVRRGLDEKYNQFVVGHPMLGEATGIFWIVAVHGAAFIDYLILNPLVFWQSVARGYGEPHYYTNPALPDDVDVEPDDRPPSREEAEEPAPQGGRR